MKLKFLLFVLLLVLPLAAQETLDKVVAVVDNEIILQSELDFQATLVAQQRKIEVTPELKTQLLNSMVNDKLVLAQANIDSISVTDEEVEQRVNYQVQMLQQQLGSKDKVEQTYGMSIEKIRKELFDDVKKNLLIQKVQEKNFGQIEVGRREVEDFYNKYKDSIGVIPEKLKISHIFRNPKSSEESKQKSLELAKAILDSIKNGGDFSDFARRYSEDPGSAVQGGDLGFVGRGVFYPEYESAAFTLKNGEMSGIVESPAGFHIIQLIEKRGDSFHTKHILIKVKADEDADLRTINFLTSVRDSILNNQGAFADFAKKYSEDTESKPYGGSLGTFYQTQLDKGMLEIVSKMKEGEISFPKRMEYGGGSYGYHIVYLEKRIAQHPANLTDDFLELKKLADEYKKQEMYEKWVAQLRQKIYFEIRL